VVGSKGIGLEINTNKVITWPCRDQNAGQSHNIETDNSPFGRVEQFKYLRALYSKSRL